MHFHQQAFTLIELMVGVAIAAILLAAGIPSFRDWIQSTQVRTATESIQAGLQLARAEAVRRNDLVRFQLVDNLTAGCALSTTGNNWVVSRNVVTALCNVAPSETNAPFIIQTRASTEGSPNAVIAADQASIIFNGLARVTNNAVPANPINIDVTNPIAGRALRVTVSTGGQIRMCDPALAATDTQGCP